MFYIWEMCLIFLLCTKHQTRERTRAHSYTQPPHTCKHAYTHAHLHTYTCAHYARTHARTHTHTHRTRKTDRQTHTHINNTNTTKTLKKVKMSFSIPQDPILRIAQSALHFTSLTALFNQAPSQLLWEASSHMLQLINCL